jgi:crotonobetainyl-CoA:carnitine CoA-transferase CaiB-like acyl-CoA transferase
LHYERLREINERLIYVSTTGYGDDPSMREEPGFDPLLQAMSGAMRQQGGPEEPVFYSVALNDVMTPLLATFGVCAALYHRERTGEGQRIRLSLAQSALAIQAAEFTRHAGSPPFIEGGRDFAGPSAAQHWYRCGDGLELVVDAGSTEERAALEGVSGCALEVEALTEAFAMRERNSWLVMLAGAGVPAAAVTARGEALRSEWARANDLVVTQEHPEYGTTTNAGLLVHASETPGRIRRVAPALSQHAVEVLTELGYTAEEQRALADSGAVLLRTPSGERAP